MSLIRVFQIALRGWGRTVKNEVFIGSLHENFYLVGRELTFGG